MTTPRRVHLYTCTAHGMIATPRKLTHCVVCRAFWREESRAREARKRSERKEGIE